MTTTATLEISPTSKRPTAKEAALRATGGAAQYTTVGHDPWRVSARSRMTTTAERAQARSDAPDAYPSGRRPNSSRARLDRKSRRVGKECRSRWSADHEIKRENRPQGGVSGT